MPRFLLALGLVATLAAPLVAQERAAPPATVDIEDKDALNKFFGEKFGAIAALMNKDADGAQKKLDELKAQVEKFEPKAADSQRLLMSAKQALTFYQGQIEVAKTPLAEIEAKIKANPDDAETLLKYVRKLSGEINAKSDEDAEAAQAMIASGRKFVGEIAAAAKQPATKTQVENVAKNFDAIERSLKAQLSRTKLIGQPAAPLNVESWVNGGALTDSDLKGKVVLLDFWAIWCGPCIATFPHLREWNEKYADKGLVMIGMTQYYNYTWDDAAEKAVRSQEQVTPEAERGMLEKFGKFHKLTHRFGIQQDKSLSEYYGVTGIPQVVVIDREGKVRMIKVGSGDANAKAIEGLLESLLGTEKADN